MRVSVASAVVTLLILTAVIALNIRPLVVTSGSMEPEIATGSLCFIRCGRQSTDIGDVIAFKRGGMTVLHRIVEKDDLGNYITKGDSNSCRDASPVAEEQIKGKYLFSVRGLGYVIWSVRHTMENFVRAVKGDHPGTYPTYQTSSS